MRTMLSGTTSFGRPPFRLQPRSPRLSVLSAVLISMTSVPVLAAPIAGDAASSAALSAMRPDIIPVHGFHRDCEPGRYGWHRHNRFDERIPCGRPGVGLYWEPGWGRRYRHDDWDRIDRNRSGDRERGEHRQSGERDGGRDSTGKDGGERGGDRGKGRD